jgi:hypothetical protein
MKSAVAGSPSLRSQRGFGKLAPDDRGEGMRAERQRLLGLGRSARAPVQPPARTCGKGFARLLNSLTGPFDVLNYYG